MQNSVKLDTKYIPKYLIDIYLEIHVHISHEKACPNDHFAEFLFTVKVARIKEINTNMYNVLAKHK